MRFLIQNNLLTPATKAIEQTKRIADITNVNPQPINPIFNYNSNLQSLLQGKQLLLEEIPFSIKEIHKHYINGYCLYNKGVEKRQAFYCCNRCGNTNQHYFASFYCARCKEICFYCRHCIMMGRISECTPLISWIGPSVVQNTKDTKLQWDGELSYGQQTASEKMEQIIDQQSELLIWAVCGAGKTEVLFKGIEKALQQNKRVCIATPRTDVVLELAPRLQEVFPDIQVLPIYGGSEDRHLYSPLIISTTHQLFRFKQTFDLIILDEMDAFPYSYDTSLQYAVQTSRKPNSAMIYLTATPNKTWRNKCQQNKINYVTIPARYHKQPLPIPQFTWCGNWEKRLEKGNLPQVIIDWIKQRIHSRKQVLLFIPKIAYMKKVKTIFEQWTPHVETVHAEDPFRKEKVQKMRKKQLELLITTTILERGVTFSNIDVAVLGAENQIFTDSALVQISGRAGRKKEYPKGDIVFFHYGKTNAMLSAKKQMENSNKEAKEKGMLI
ncbi:DEAD/DEAH box helicase [Niallia nealsonii]|uniref:DNA/RNA helicase n=1 Tax=Niallia nealsonii TaxID=115979 RepID=A0A2N0YXU9_9BACI|nr:DEAD/DEAH box helicase [Niallia nealsonii]PKG22087.1 DNA/RNA helicase [Niallia nealsonii]